MFQGICAILRCCSRPSLGGDELAIERLQARAIRRVLATDFRATLQLLSRLRWGRCMDLGSHGLSLVSWLAPMPILPNRAGDRWERFERLHLGWCPTVLVYRENKLGEVQRRISVVGLHIYIDARTSKWRPQNPKFRSPSVPADPARCGGGHPPSIEPERDRERARSHQVSVPAPPARPLAGDSGQGVRVETAVDLDALLVVSVQITLATLAMLSALALVLRVLRRGEAQVRRRPPLSPRRPRCPLDHPRRRPRPAPAGDLRLTAGSGRPPSRTRRPGRPAPAREDRPSAVANAASVAAMLGVLWLMVSTPQ